jgi:hypothetical protein
LDLFLLTFHLLLVFSCRVFFPAAYLPKILDVILVSISYILYCISKCFSPVNLLFQPLEYHFFIISFYNIFFIRSCILVSDLIYSVFFVLALCMYSIFIRVFRPEPRNLYPLLMRNIISRGGKILSFHCVQFYTASAL